ncbi:MAG: winged helix-turn-helix transcriptional regulator [Ignavibacteriales bacterium]|nr:winged helix-turn-helix transcriptional regulator [Ignavibacteriales bacterium]
MPTAKTDGFKNQDIRLAEIAKALSHPARVAILRHLAKRNDCVCGEIVDVIPLAQATVSQHLKELKRVGLIKGEIDGPRSCYCINTDTMKQASGMLGEFLSTMKKCC